MQSPQKNSLTPKLKLLDNIITLLQEKELSKIKKKRKG